MATPLPAVSEDERLPILLGFQRVADTTTRGTRVMERGRGIYVYDTSGPYTDPNVIIDVNAGLPRTRTALVKPTPKGALGSA